MVLVADLPADLAHLVGYGENMNTVAWHGPPSDVLGHPAPIQQFVTRTDHAVVALQQVIAFPEGCSLTLRIAVRRNSPRDSLAESVWERLHGSHTGRHFDAEPTDAEPTDADLKFGVRFPDGSRATTVDHAFRGWAHPTDRPEPPMLIEAGGQSSSGDWRYDSDQLLWLWPLPAPGPFEFVIEWQKMGIDITATTLDGTAIARAAEQAVPYWS